MNISSNSKEMKTKYSTKKYAGGLCIQGLTGDNRGHPATCLPCDLSGKSLLLLSTHMHMPPRPLSVAVFSLEYKLIL